MKIKVVIETTVLNEIYRDLNAIFPELAKQFMEEKKIGRRPIRCYQGDKSRLFIPIEKSRFIDFGTTNKIVAEAEVFRFISVSI